MIDSPCIGICALHKINNQTLCAGCKRNPNEIRNWMKFSNEEKKEVIKEANEIYGVKKVIPSIILVEDLSRNKN